ncbi:hypothetical protein ABW20_dc0106597 [Dactylellina cionopaga]|nr:hypothetical protein ABW20_dc0106597 [Dactylellina cionopaga]
MQDAVGDTEFSHPQHSQEETNGVSIEFEAQKAELLRDPPQTNGTVTPVKRSHDLATTTGPELNGTLGQRPKRAKTVAAAVDENAMVIDGIGLPDTTSEEVRATIGSSVGVQADEYIQLDHESTGVYELSPQDTSQDGWARNCRFSPAENNTLAISLKTYSHMFDLGENLFTPNRSIKDLPLYQDYDMEISTIAWSDNGEYLATASWSGVIKIWDSRGRLRQSLNMHHAPLLSLKFHPTKHHLLLSVDSRTRVCIWDVTTGKMKKLCELSSVNSTAERNTPHDADWIDENTIVVVGDNGAVEKFDLSMPPDSKGPQFAMRYEGHDTHKHVNSVVWSEGDDVFATGGEEGKILVCFSSTVGWFPNYGNRPNKNPSAS